MKKSRKTVLTVLLICCILGTLTAGIFAADDPSGTPEPETLTEEVLSEDTEDIAAPEFTYTVQRSGKIRITGLNADFEGALVIPAMIDGYAVDEIDRYAFCNHTGITSVTFESSVTYIYSYAFQGCTSLKSITLPEGLQNIGLSVFYNCKSLEQVTIPSTVTYIESHAFGNCTSLQSITIPSSVKRISGFDGCTALTEVVLNEGLQSIKWAFSGCTALKSIVLPSTVTSISDSCFSGCTALTDISLNEGLTTIGASAFYNCSSLQSIALPSTVVSVGSSCFSGCTSLSDISLNEGLTSMGSGVFLKCTSLTELRLPASLNQINGYLTEGCTSLERVELAEGNDAFVVENGALTDAARTALLCYPYRNPAEDYTLPEGVTAIPNRCFYGNENLKHITLPASLTSIGDYAFADSALESVSFGGSVAAIGKYAFQKTALTALNFDASSIGDYAFYQCENLQTLVLGDSVQTIGKFAFRGCVALETATLGDGVTLIDEYAFSGCTQLQTVDGGVNVSVVEDQAFANCTSLQTVGFGANVTRIEYYAFNKCTSLTMVPIGEKTTKIGITAFADCSSLQSLVLPDSIQLVDSFAFSSTGLTTLDLGHGSPTFGLSPFSGCVNLKQVTIPGTYKTVAKSMFDANHLEKVIIEEGVERIESYAFAGASPYSLTEISLPESLTYIGDHAFDNHRCSEIVIPSGVNYIGSMAFNGRTNYDVYCYAMNPEFDANSCPFNVNYWTGTVTIHAYRNSTIRSYIENCPNLGDYHKHVLIDLCEEFGHTPAEVCAFETVCRYCGEVISGHTDEDGDTFCDICGLSVTEPPVDPIDPEEPTAPDIPEETTDPDTPEETTDPDTPEEPTDPEPDTPDCTLTYDDGILSVSGNAIREGDYADEISSYADEVKTIVFEDGFTALGDGVFSSMSALQMVYIPGSVSSIGDGVFADCPNLGNMLILSDSISFSTDTFDADASFNLFLREDAAVTGLENLPVGVNVIRFAFDGETLSFTGHLSADMYNLFDIASLFSLAYDNIMTLHFEQFTAVDFQVYGRYENSYNTLRRTEFENVDFSIKVLVDGAYQTVSFNEVYEMAADGYGDYYYLVTETDEENIDYDDTQISVVDQLRELIARVVSAIVKLLNKLFAFFKKITGK